MLWLVLFLGKNLGNEMSLWNLAEFKNVHPPRVANTMSKIHREFYCIRILDMPVKVPNGSIQIPPPLYWWNEFVNKAISAARHTFGFLAVERKFAYLTIDQGLVKKNTTQRASGYHVDGFQGARLPYNVEPDFNYVVSDCLPTVFSVQSYNFDGLDLAKHNLFHEMDRQARPENDWRPKPLEIVECSAYTVHRADSAPHDMERTFMRLTFSVREFDRKGNTINPLFGSMWKYVSRETPDNLI